MGEITARVNPEGPMEENRKSKGSTRERRGSCPQIKQYRQDANACEVPSLMQDQLPHEGCFVIAARILRTAQGTCYISDMELQRKRKWETKKI